MIGVCPYCNSVFTGALQQHKRRCTALAPIKTPDRRIVSRDPGKVSTAQPILVARVPPAHPHYSKEYGWKLRQCVRKGVLPKGILKGD